MQHRTETLPNGTFVCTSTEHRFGTDSLLLANFCKPWRNWSACDLGSGCGILLLSLIDNGLQGPAVGVELNPAGTALLSLAAKENKLNNITALTADIRDFSYNKLFDIVVSNPPYFSNGPLPPNAQRASARHETNCTIGQLCKTASRILKDGSPFCLCYPANRLAQLFAALQFENFAPKRLQFVRKNNESTPWLVLVDARKNGGAGLDILPDFVRGNTAVHF